ncbi:MAG TPA: hypothetical protein VNL73_08450 [Verrucomicrobiae bacterium]|nr:hypothetical protein [Verrucomicrobiae bacterium]
MTIIPSCALAVDFNANFSLSGKVALTDSIVKFAFIKTAQVGPSGRIVSVCAGFKKVGVRHYAGLRIYSAAGSLQKHVSIKNLRKMVEQWSNRYLVNLLDAVENHKGDLIATSSRHLLFFDRSGVLHKAIELSNLSKLDKELANAGGLQEAREVITKKGTWKSIYQVDVGPNGEIVGAGPGHPQPHCLHTFDSTGRLLKDFLLLEPEYADYYNFEGLDVDSLGDIWCVFDPFYKVFHYGMDGTSKGEILGKSSVFKSPQDRKAPSSTKKWLRWLKSWTPVVDCAATQSGYVILVMLAGEAGKPYMKSYDPEGDMYEGGFFIDIYDREGNMITGGLHTPHRFLCVDDKDNLWFDLRPDTPENPGPPLSKGRSKPEKEPTAVLGKFRLKLPPAARKAETK